MGIYTNYVGSGYSSNYTDVQPFVGENFNYHELGILAASEIAANHNAFMKSIALSELAAFEQTGSTDVLYEAVDFKGIFEKIKMFFKKIIEKIHKIFHTFVAKMSSWFGGNASFAKTYEKEVVKGWANVKNDWSFKGYKFNKTAIRLTKDTAETEIKVKVAAGSEALKGALENAKLEDLAKSKNIESDKEELKKIREKMDDIKDAMRKQVVDDLKAGNITMDVDASQSSGGYDASEFSEELFKCLRSGEDSKEDIDKKDLLDQYDGSISGMMTYIKDFDKIKSKTEAAERKITKGIDSLINKIDKAQNELVKTNRDSGTTQDDKEKNELIIQASSVLQSLYGSLSECLTQAFSALLQAQKDACVQAKEIAVKVIGQSKKMTEESYDYSSSYNSNNGFDFISSVKLI